jgi:hypothetical protein
MEDHVHGAYYMVNQARQFKKIADVFKDNAVKDDIANKFGQKVVNTLQEQVQSLSLAGTRAGLDAVQSAFVKYVGQWSLAKVALNPLSFAGQLSAYHAYSNNMPTGKYYADFMYALAHPKEIHKFMKEHVGDYLENRLNGGFNETIKGLTEYKKGSAGRARLNVALSSLMRYGDYASIVWGGYPRLKYLLNEKDAYGNPIRTADEAKRIYMQETEESMQSGTQSSLSRFQRSPGIARIFTTFKNQQSQYVRKMFDAWAEYARGEISAGQLTKTIVNYGVVNTVLFTVLRAAAKVAVVALPAAMLGGDDGEEFEKEISDLGGDIITNIALGSLDPIPVVRDIGETVMRKIRGEKRIPGGGTQILAVDDIMRGVEKALWGKIDDYHDVVEIIGPVVETFVAPVPVVQYDRYLKKWGF